MPDRTTPTVHFRIPAVLWQAYGRVTARLGRSRTEDLLAHVKRTIERHGDADDLADMAVADSELAERRSRKGGRPARPR